VLHTVTVFWDASAGATGYDIYWGPASGVYTGAGSPVSVGAVTTGSFTLTQDGPAFIAVKATNGALASPFSNEITGNFNEPGRGSLALTGAAPIRSVGTRLQPGSMRRGE